MPRFRRPVAILRITDSASPSVDQGSADDLAALLTPAFTLTHAETLLHRTPARAEQQFTWVTARRTNDSH